MSHTKCQPSILAAKLVSSRKAALELSISRTNVQRILRKDIRLRVYKIQIKPLLTDEYKGKRMKLANWIRTNLRKENTMKISFFYEKTFNIDGVYNSQNDRIWAANHLSVNTKGGIPQKCKFSQEVMVWLGVCSKGVSQGSASNCSQVW